MAAILAHCGGPMVSSIKLGGLGRVFGVAVASLCNSSEEAPQQKINRGLASVGKQKSMEILQSVLNLNTIAEDEEVDQDDEFRQQLVRDRKKIVELTRTCKKLEALGDWQQKQLEEKDREIQDWATKVEDLQKGADVASEKRVQSLDEKLEAEWQQFELEEKDDEIKKLRAEVEKLKAEKAGQGSSRFTALLQLRAENTEVLGADPLRARFQRPSTYPITNKANDPINDIMNKANDPINDIMNSPIAGA